MGCILHRSEAVTENHGFRYCTEIVCWQEALTIAFLMGHQNKIRNQISKLQWRNQSSQEKLQHGLSEGETGVEKQESLPRGVHILEHSKGCLFFFFGGVLFKKAPKSHVCILVKFPTYTQCARASYRFNFSIVFLVFICAHSNSNWNFQMWKKKNLPLWFYCLSCILFLGDLNGWVLSLHKHFRWSLRNLRFQCDYPLWKWDSL